MIKGINVKESRGELLVGIKKEDFLAAIAELPEKDGWVNLVFSPRKEVHPGGYTHFIRPEKKKNHG